MSSQRGTVSPIALLMVLLLTLAFLQALGAMLATKKKLGHRSRAYLCFKYQLTRMRKYVREMGRLNRVLRTSYYAQFAPEVHIASAAAATHEATLKLQSAAHLLHYRRLLKNRHCGAKDAIFFLRAMPYQGDGPQLVRHIDGTSKLRSTRWNILYRHKNITLQASAQLNSALSGKITLSTGEVDSSNWRDSSGWGWWR